MAGGGQVRTLAYRQHCCTMDLLERHGTVQITVRALAVAMLRRWRVLPAAPAAGVAAGALNIQLFICCVCAPDACAADEQPFCVFTQVTAPLLPKPWCMCNGMLGECSANMAW